MKVMYHLVQGSRMSLGMYLYITLEETNLCLPADGSAARDRSKNGKYISGLAALHVYFSAS